MKKILVVMFCAGNTDTDKNIIDVNNHLDKRN